ncbi:tannase and feruloyl esterase [Neofusicoccum parvum]|nr:tannase and feruloyl esterase [Neofusicoccum parvum]
MYQFSWPGATFWPFSSTTSISTGSAARSSASSVAAALLLFLLAPLPRVQSIPQTLPHARDRCTELKARHLQGNDLIVTNATFVDAYALNVSGTLNVLPLCRLASQLAYGSNDTLNFEVWMPHDVEYNGRYLAVGTLSCTMQPGNEQRCHM